MGATTEKADIQSLVAELFGRGIVDPMAVAAACAPSVVWNDMGAKAPYEGPAAVQADLESRFPPGARLVVDRVSDGASSGGFTWHREAADAPGTIGLRGTIYLELDGDGRIAYVQEGCEPLFKAGEGTEALLKAATANAEKPERNPTFTPQTPTTASGVARYLWEEAYPGGADPTEALRLFSPQIRYEDFNYEQPFVGTAQVTEFVKAFDIAGIDFVPLKISEGERACCFTWKVAINGNDGPSGLSFYEVDEAGRVVFIRDIPAPFPRGFRPLLALAAAVDPARRVLGQAALARAALGAASQVMGLLRPVFAAEAAWQAEALAGDAAPRVRADAAARLDEDKASAGVVLYTYGLSPFSAEALALLDAEGCTYRQIELGAEWFLLSAEGAALRAELLERTGQSSLPHVFIGGESVGGLFSGHKAGVGLAELKRQGKLAPMLEAAGALAPRGEAGQ